MSDELQAQATVVAADPKQKKKVRSAWISFTSRILAQLIGAAATVVLGVVALQRYQVVQTPAVQASAAPRPAAADWVRVPGALPKIAVLPFENYSGDAQYEHFANAMTESLVASLAAVDSVRVISRTSSMHYKGSRKGLPEIGRELGADFLIESSITKSGTRARVVAQLIDARTDEHVWSRSYTRDIGDGLGLQAEVTDAIARDVKAVMALAGQWQEPAPVSRKNAPETGTNSQR